MRMLGFVLIALGLVGLLWGGISWTQREQVVDLGPIEVEREERETLPIPPIAGAVLLIAGGALVASSRRR